MVMPTTHCVLDVPLMTAVINVVCARACVCRLVVAAALTRTSQCVRVFLRVCKKVSLRCLRRQSVPAHTCANTAVSLHRSMFSYIEGHGLRLIDGYIGVLV